MSSSLNRIYCQNCRAVNPFTSDLCSQCGTRLMLVANSALVRHEDNSATYVHQEHLLERISILENNLSRLAEKSEEALNLLLRQARGSYLDHTLLETLIRLLGGAGQIDTHKLRREWRRRRDEELEAGAERERQKATRAKILGAYRGTEAKRFTRHVELAFQSLERGEAERAIRFLERAAALHPEGGVLHLLTGRLLLGLHKLSLAGEYLGRAHRANPRDPHVCLLYGLTLAERGEDERASTLLSEALSALPALFAAQAALGLLSARAGRWADALKAFKLAHGARPGAESSFLMGTAYYARGFYRAARRALEGALEGGESEASVHYLHGLVLLRLKEREGARGALREAARLAPKNAVYRAAARGPLAQVERRTKQPLLFASGSRKLITGAPAFVTEAIIGEALALTAG